MAAINERTDDCLLTDDELYELKGGNDHVATKAAVGLGFVIAYLLATRKISEFTSLSVTGNYKVLFLGFNFFNSFNFKNKKNSFQVYLFVFELLKKIKINFCCN